jgi:hypothetical protein
MTKGLRLADVLADALRDLNVSKPLVVAAGDGDPALSQAECLAMAAAVPDSRELLYPKAHLGNLFAAAAAVQVALAAAWADRQSAGVPVLANCFGPGSEQAAFALEAL